MNVHRFALLKWKTRVVRNSLDREKGKKKCYLIHLTDSKLLQYYCTVKWIAMFDRPNASNHLNHI